MSITIWQSFANNHFVNVLRALEIVFFRSASLFRRLMTLTTEIEKLLSNYYL